MQASRYLAYNQFHLISVHKINSCKPTRMLRVYCVYKCITRTYRAYNSVLNCDVRRWCQRTVEWWQAHRRWRVVDAARGPWTTASECTAVCHHLYGQHQQLRRHEQRSVVSSSCPRRTFPPSLPTRSSTVDRTASLQRQPPTRRRLKPKPKLKLHRLFDVQCLFDTAVR